MCRDLVPFDAVEKQGFIDFCKKNTSFPLPSRTTIACTALVDVFTATKAKVLSILESVFSGTLMMDGWTDRYNKYPYFAIRLSAIVDWRFEVITLSASAACNRSHVQVAV